VAAARAAFHAGERTKALEHLNHALSIDPSFLAAQSLRERVLAAPLDGGSSRPPIQASDAPPMVAAVPAAPPPAPAVIPRPPSFETRQNAQRDAGSRTRSPREAHGRIELRAKQRRVDHCIAAARAALGRGHVDAAAAALSELITLEPNESNVISLAAELADLRRRSERRPFGVRLAAAAAFIAVAGAASWLERPRHATPAVEVATAVSAPNPAEARALPVRETPIEPAPTPLERVDRVTSSDKSAAQVKTPAAAPTRVTDLLAARQAPPPASSTTVPISLPVPLSQLPPRTLTSAPTPTLPPPVVARAPEPTTAELTITAAPPVSAPSIPTPTAAAIRTPDDQELVEDALQRYRRAYGRLNVQSALAVYPTVNRVALARAFDGLESQALTFDSCDVELRGALARAICHGSARYVPKVGSREAHTEPLVWSFELRKSEGDWTIESAKASR